MNLQEFWNEVRRQQEVAISCFCAAVAQASIKPYLMCYDVDSLSDADYKAIAERVCRDFPLVSVDVLI